MQKNGTVAVTGLSITQAEELLDWLEAHGCSDRKFSCDSGQSFTVHYRPNTRTGRP